MKLYTISWFTLSDRDCGDALGPCSLGLPHQNGEQSITDMLICNDWTVRMLWTV